MNILESIFSAFSSVMSNKMRSILTMLGIIIGISSVIMITSIGQGFQNSVVGSLSKLGLERLQVNLKTDEEIKQSDYLRMDDLDLINTHPAVKYASPMWQAMGSVRLKNPKETERCYFMGSDPNYRFVQNVDLVHGRFLMDPDMKSKGRVAVIDEDLSKKIFGRSNSVGETIQVVFWSGSADLTVVGVSKSEQYNAMFQMPSIIYIPVTTIMDIYSSEVLDTIYVTVTDRDKMDQTALEIAKLLNLKHKTKDKYFVQNLMKEMDSINDIFRNITAFVGLVAAISLIVGGIGVMNIMLVTVTERTREIGIRKSLGATDNNIKFQFLVEAMILTAIGGLIGIVLGYSGSFAIGGLIDLVPAVSIPTVLGTVLISSLIGIVFGVYPAGKAAKLDPIEALRYE